MVIKPPYRGCALHVAEKNIFEVTDCWKLAGTCIKFGLVLNTPLMSRVFIVFTHLYTVLNLIHNQANLL